MRFLICSGCWMPSAYVRLVPTSCLHCGGTKWTAIPNLGEEPKPKYELTHMDKRLLKSLRIDSEVPEV